MCAFRASAFRYTWLKKKFWSESKIVCIIRTKWHFIFFNERKWAACLFQYTVNCCQLWMVESVLIFLPLIYADKFSLPCKLKNWRRLSIESLDKGLHIGHFYHKIWCEKLGSHTLLWVELCPLKTYVEEWTQRNEAFIVATNCGPSSNNCPYPHRVSHWSQSATWVHLQPESTYWVTLVSILVMPKMCNLCHANIRFSSQFQESFENWQILICIVFGQS